MSVNAGVVLGTARTLLNDDAATNWTDASLMPKLQHAHRELQIKLRRAAAPLMKTTYLEVVSAGATAFSTPPADVVAPITLWEGPSPIVTPINYQLMTEADPLPNLAAQTSLVWWAWVQEAVAFLGATTTRSVKMLYWRALPIPAASTDLVGFINGELYLAPRTAALAAGSVGESERFGVLSSLAETSLGEVILSNRGRAPQAAGASVKP